ncbi:MAG: hypothetical protein ACE5JI_13240, partial [Acidobacteriota bacterium]
RAKTHLEAVHADLRGVVLNDIKAEVSGFSPAEYYAQYYSRYAQRTEAAPGLFQRAVSRVRSRFGNSEPPARRSQGAGSSGTRTGGGSEYEAVLRVTDENERPPNEGS